jgi:hypothetical protein
MFASRMTSGSNHRQGARRRRDLREAAIALGFVTAEEYDLYVDSARMALGYADRVGDPP